MAHGTDVTGTEYGMFLHRRRRQGTGGLQPSQLWTNLQKSAIIRQKISLKSGKLFVNNESVIGSPLNLFPPALMRFGTRCCPCGTVVQFTRHHSLYNNGARFQNS